MTTSSSLTTTVQVTNKRKAQKRGIFSIFFKNPKALVGFVIFAFFVLLAIFAPLIAPYHPEATIFDPSAHPSKAHLFGTTNTGQDLFSQFIWGARTSMIVGVGAGVVSTLVGVLIGVTAGYRGGVTDSILNAICNIFLVLPGLALLIIIESYVRNTTPYLNGLIIALTGWAWGARVFRSMAMTLTNRDFIAAARLSGASTLRIIYAELVPNMTSVIVANLMYASLGAILAESGLAYLGFENLSSASWGTMLYWAQSGGAMMSGEWWWFVPPGLAIAVVGTSFALMNFSIDEITNPRLRSNRKKLKQYLANERRLEGHVGSETSA
jgi:peptide/nickel transport system permease protein